MTQLVLGEQGRAALLRSREEAYAVARARVMKPHAPNTHRTYETAFARWCAYCDAVPMPWGPIDPAELVTYLEQLSKTHAPNTVRLHMSALCQLDRGTRVTGADPNPQSLAEHPIVQRWLESWGRDNPKGPRRRAAALQASDLERLLAAAAEPVGRAARAAHVQRYVRDRCLILFGVCGALRGDDLAALELGHVQLTARGLQLYIARSKGDQEGEGAYVGLMPQGRLNLCPVDAYTTWRKLRGDEPGPLFCGISRDAQLRIADGISERQITRLIKGYAERAGLELAISAHSMRATFATLAASQGKHLSKIMQHGRWKSAEVASGYVRQGELFNDNVSGGLLD